MSWINASEHIIDRFLLQALSNKREVTIAARGGLVLNDATLKETVEAGLDVTKSLSQLELLYLV
ncbi:MAG: hypothetical protein B6U94_07775 [Thermofilum sp. ex4484_79]|nr:MAG: hypothetical protein B6U94_07775 [Thermofilum sp. ex4484_79]